MKLQDIAFIIVLTGLILMRRPKWFVISGMIAILLSLPLFYMKTALFTAQRLVMYAAVWYWAAAVLEMIRMRRERNK